MLGDNLTLGIIIAAAVTDSINPCVFGVLIFLIAFMLKLFKSPGRMLLGGFLYTAVVYGTYLLLGFGILKLALNTGLAFTFYWIPAGNAVLSRPGGIKYYTNKIEGMERHHPAVLFLMTALLGVLVVLVELPCTGAPYLAILGLLSKGEFATAVPLLLLYNFIFVVPLFIIIGIAYFGTSSDRLEAWRKEHRGFMRLAIGLFLLALGLYMAYTINFGF